MSKVSYSQFFATLSGDSRLEIVQFLRNNGTQNVSEIAAGTNMEQSAVSHSLKKLQACECVHVEARGKQRYYRLNNETIEPLLDLADSHIENFCQNQCSHCQT